MAQSKDKVMVIKIGSSTLVDAEGHLDRSYLAGLAKQINEVKQCGWKPVIVSSAAIACGLEELGIKERPQDMPSLQAAASVGQNTLISAYAAEFARYGIRTSIILMTRQTTADRESYLHARDTLARLLELDVVPIINENDTISVEQIRFGDNDTLAALVSCLIKADLCVIFSDIEGLYTANPFIDPSAHLISEVEKITPEIMAIAGGVTSKVGSGGMITKIRAARVLMVAGIEMIICHGRLENNLIKIISGQPVGTVFTPLSTHDITPRKLWIALGDTAKGSLVVDNGAKQALISKGSSLLAVGVCGLEGSFVPGDIVDIKDKNDHLFARGKAGASSSEIMLACGRSQQEIKNNELLVNLAVRPVVHRDELVVFE